MLRIGLDAQVLVKLGGGVSYYVYYLLDELVKQKKDAVFFLYALSDKGDIEHFKQYENVIIRKIPYPPFKPIWRVLTIPFFLWKDKIDVFWGTVQSLPLFISKKTKTLLTLYDFVYLLYPETMSLKGMLYQKSLVKRSLHKADYILPISRGTGERLKEIYGLDHHAVIYPPNKPEIFYKERRIVEPFLASRALSYNNYLVTVGTWEPRKNFAELVRIYQRILERNDPNKIMPLVIVGGGGWKNRAIQEAFASAQKKYPAHFKIAGYLSDRELSFYLSGAKYYITLSLYEGYGMPLAEARRCRTPVICYDTPEMREAAENDGIFLKQEDVEKKLDELFLIQPPATFEEKAPIILRYPTNTGSAAKMAAILHACNRAKSC